jgi:glycerol kinase
MYTVVIDQGTSSTRAILFDMNGKIIKQSFQHVTQIYPQSGWVEHSPEEIWKHTCLVLKNVTNGVAPHQILACGITNQRETVVCWDKNTGKCFYNALVWQDRRTQAFCDSHMDVNELIHQKTGLICDPYFSASKINWLLKNILQSSGLSNVAIGTIDSFLIWRLTKGLSHKTDITNASRTMLFNINEQDWDEELLNLFAIPPSILPDVCDSDAHFGFIHKDIIGYEIPILSVIGDQQAALIGIGATSKNAMKVTYGTGGFLMLNTGEERLEINKHLLTTIAYKINKKICYALEGNMYDAGSLMDWLKNKLNLVSDYQEIDNLSASVHSTDGVYFIPSFSGLGAPHWITHKGATFINMSRDTTKAHLVRATQESIGYQTLDIIDAIRNYHPINLEQIYIDGGMSKSRWFIQFLSNLTRLTISIPESLENTAKGAALVASLRFMDNIDLNELASRWQNFETLFPLEDTSFSNNYLNWVREIAKLKKN